MKNLFFFIFFIEIFPRIIFSIKTEIKFNLNVPSLFRCKRKGRVFYFENFPTVNLFNQINDCDLSLISSNKRITFYIEKLDLQCDHRFLATDDSVNEIISFKSNCTANDLCIRLTPSAVTLIRNFRTQSYQTKSIDLDINGIGTGDISIGEKHQYPYNYMNDGYLQSGYKKYQIIFKMKDNKYLDLMCEYTYINIPEGTKSICPRRGWIFSKDISQMRNGNMTATGDGWSWLCYYYPSGAENATDHMMISKAIEDLEKTNSSKSQTLSIFRLSNQTEFPDNSSILPNKDSSSFTSTFLFIIITILIIIGIFYVYKKNSQIKLKERSSLESQNSVISNEDD